jgi:uncharacterized protein (TIGR02186 family)
MKCLLTLLLLFIAPTAIGKPLVADISSHEITIHTSFEGTELMLFGARNAAGDIVVVIRGPRRDATIRRKEQVGGMWINRTEEVFGGIPGFYAMAASKPLEEIQKSIYFQPLGIGFEEAVSSGPLMEMPRGERKVFARALLRDLRAKRLYAILPGKVTFIGETLFKATVPFPDNMPRGDYTAEVYLFSGGTLVGMQTTPIHVYKSGFDAFIYETAHRHPLLYGLVAVMLALFSGWAVSSIFEKI